MGIEKGMDKEIVKRAFMGANRLIFMDTLRNAHGVDEKLEAMKDLARQGVLHSMDREGLPDNLLELIDEIIADEGQTPLMRPVDQWD